MQNVILCRVYPFGSNTQRYKMQRVNNLRVGPNAKIEHIQSMTKVGLTEMFDQLQSFFLFDKN